MTTLCLSALTRDKVCEGIDNDGGTLLKLGSEYLCNTFDQLETKVCNNH